MLNSLQIGRCSSISRKNQFLYSVNFHIPILVLLVQKSSLQSPLTLPSSIPQQFPTSFFLRTTISTSYTKNIFPISTNLPIHTKGPEVRNLGSLLRTGTVLISPFFVWTVKTGLTITDSLLLRLWILVYFRSGKPSNPPSLIPSDYCHYFHTLIIPPQELTFPWKTLLNLIFIHPSKFSTLIY